MNSTAVNNCEVSRNRGLERSTTLETLKRIVKDLAFAELLGAKAKDLLSRSCLRTLVGFTASIIVSSLTVTAYGADECFARQGTTSIVDKESSARYMRKLFLTPDEMARYVFLTNRRDDGDRSAAVYRARGKKESLPGDYWLTATMAVDSVRGDRRNVPVRRFDAPLPASVANVLHELWLAVCQQSHTDEEALPSAPTGIFSVTTAGGKRLTVVTVSLLDEHSLCFSLLNLSGSLSDYAKLPASDRPRAAANIEKESVKLLQRVAQKK